MSGISGVEANEARRRFAEWLSVPPSKRIPKTQRELALELGVSRERLSRWAKEPGFKGEVVAAGLDWFSANDLNEIVTAMKLKAKRGDVPAAKLVFQMAGFDIDARRQKPPEERGPVGEMSDAELEAVIAGDPED